MGLSITPMTLREANEYVEKHHRHNKPCRGHKFSFGVVGPSGLCGIAICGRPVARWLDDGCTLEVSRTCTDGVLGANSKLYAAARDIAKAMGYRRLITYTQGDEQGKSLKVAGFVQVAELEPRGSWAESTNGALKAMRDPIGNGGVPRKRWQIVFEGAA